MSLLTTITRHKGDDYEAEPAVVQVEQGNVVVVVLDDGEELWFDLSDLRAALDGEQDVAA